MVGWLWLVLGCLLFVIYHIYKKPFVLPASYSSICVALAISLYPLGDLFQLVTFGLLLVGGIGVVFFQYRKYEGFNNPDEKQASKLIGAKVSLLKPIRNGVGRVQLDDSLWEASSADDLEKGILVEVIGYSGTRLHVASCVAP